MTKQADEAIRSGASHVDEVQQMGAGYSTPKDVSVSESQPEDADGHIPVETELTNVTLSMFEQAGQVRIRVGNAHNAAELFEGIYASADEANTAMLDGEILTPEQVPDPTVVAGTSLPVTGVTTEKLLAAGLKRRGGDTL